MGMDVYGKAPKSEKGEYFRNNVWWWRPLWDYCEQVFPACNLVDGHSNSGDGFDEENAIALARTLKTELEAGRTAQWEKNYLDTIANLPDEPCDFCSGMGIVQVKEGWPDYVEGEVKFRDPCNACDGKKTKRPWQSNYPFSVENVQEFAEFLTDSGGFEIC